MQKVLSTDLSEAIRTGFRNSSTSYETCLLVLSVSGGLSSTCRASGMAWDITRLPVYPGCTEQGPCARAGVVNGMQSSLQNLLGSLSYALALFIWQPQLFVVLMAGSVVVVSASLALYLYCAGAQQWLSERLNGQHSYQAMHGGPHEQA